MSTMKVLRNLIWPRPVSSSESSSLAVDGRPDLTNQSSLKRRKTTMVECTNATTSRPIPVVPPPSTSPCRMEVDAPSMMYVDESSCPRPDGGMTGHDYRTVSSWSSSSLPSSSTPSPVTAQQYISQALAQNGLPDRLDPLSPDHFMYFEQINDDSDDDGYVQGMTSSTNTTTIVRIDEETAIAIREDDVDSFRRRFRTSSSSLDHEQQQQHKHGLVDLRIPLGQTVLHLACRYGSYSVGKALLYDYHTPTMVRDDLGRTPLRSLCIGFNDEGEVPSFPRRQFSSSDSRTSQHHNYRSHRRIEMMKWLLERSPCLILYTDVDGKTPFQYLVGSELSTPPSITYHHHTPLIVIEMLQGECVVERAGETIARRTREAQSGRRLSALDVVDKMVDLSGIELAILESGFCI